MDPVVFFFLLGVFARLARSDLRLPDAMYEALSIFLLLAIGLKGGVELAKLPFASVAVQSGAVVAMGFILPIPAYAILPGPMRHRSRRTTVRSAWSPSRSPPHS
jgi:hypothetical protein